MVFVVTGLNHKTAPLFVREKLALISTPERDALGQLLGLFFIDEALILSTCNRTEIYASTPYPEKLIEWLADASGLAVDALRPHIYQHQDVAGVQHLLRVASGLDSMMLGEPQILGQLKQAYRAADEKNGLRRELQHIFPFVFSASKRIRTQSGIGNNPISVASAAVRLMGDFFHDFASLEVLVIGSGETAALVSKYLYQQGVRRFTVASRTRENAEKLALQWQANTLSITDIPAHLKKTDVVISATACPLPFIDKAMLNQVIKSTRTKPLFLLDLAVPRDIAADVAELPYTHLYNIDDLHIAIEKGLDERKTAAAHAEKLIPDALSDYLRSHRVRAAQAIICNYREQMQDLAAEELTRATSKLHAGHCEHVVIREFSSRLVNKLMHTTTVGLQQAAADKKEDVLTLTHYLLNQIKHEEITETEA